MATTTNSRLDILSSKNEEDVNISSNNKDGKTATMDVHKSVKRAAAARLVEEETIFTFKPKVSPQSIKIAESLGTDFMSRHQQHIERQKKYVSYNFTFEIDRSNTNLGDILCNILM